MLHNYVKVGLRHLQRHRGHAAINICGLAIGLACGILIFLFVRKEVGYDRFHEKAERIFRITYDEFGTAAQRHLATVSPPMGPALVTEYPQIEQFVRMRDSGRQVFTRGDARFYEEDFFYVDSTFFDVFSFRLAHGNPQTALTASNSAVLSRETAAKYFGDEDPMGQSFQMNDGTVITVTGILDDTPYDSHLNFDFLLSFSTFRIPLGYPVTLDDWSWISFHTYVLLSEGVDSRAVEAELPAFMARHFDADRASRAALRLQPVTDIYLGEPRHPEMLSGNTSYLYGLTGAAFLILLLACFNFANLSTAQAVRRGREVGVRKVLGANRFDLTRQYLGESLFLAAVALAVSLVLVYAGLEAGNRWLDLELSIRTVDIAAGAVVFLLIAAIAGVAAGIYPAYVLSSFRPAHVLKGDVGAGVRGTRLRGVLVIGQFAIAIALTVGTVVVSRQMEFVQSKELGFDQEGLLALHLQGENLLTRYDALEEVLLNNPHVISVTKSGDMFDGDQGSVPIQAEGATSENVRPMPIYGMYYDFVETMGIELVAGRGPSRDVATDSSDAILLNSTAARVLAATVPGWEDPLGKAIRVGGIMEGRVIGVVEDFHFASLHTPVEPLVLYFPRTAIDKIIVRVRPGSVSATLASLERDWQSVVPDFPFAYQFLDEHVAQLYRSDLRFSRLISVFSALTLLVACMGLYGLISFMSQLRTKEIGIRKVLGASVAGIVSLLSRRFVMYGLIANVIAWPVAYLGMQRWLDTFAYHIEPGIGTFALAGFAAIAIALASISFEAVKAATADPVRSLRQP